MIADIKHISNPLTVIAIFAGLTEVGGIYVLPKIASENQFLFTWFLILFPILLVGLFFLTLNFNPKVLYAPSDYREDKSFLAVISNVQYQNASEDRGLTSGISIGQGS